MNTETVTHPHWRARLPRSAPASRAVVAVVALHVCAIALAQPVGAPTWVVAGPGDTFSREGQGAAYVEAYAHPEGTSRSSTGLFVACEPHSSDGYDVFAWIGGHPMPAKDVMADTIEVMTRRDQDSVRTATWSLFGDDRRVRADAATRAALLDDLRRGGTFALRVLTDPTLGAAQPTFQFVVDGFASVESRLACNARTESAPDPFATTPAPPPPLTGPGVGGGPSTAAPAPAAPEAEASAYEMHPITGLPSLGTLLTGYDFIGERAELAELVNEDGFLAIMSVTVDGVRGVAFECAPEGASAGQNGTWATIASPKVLAGTLGFFVLFHAGVEVGEVEYAAESDEEGFVLAYVLYDDMEVDLSRALAAYDTLDALLIDESDEIVDSWRIDTTGFVAARSTLGCSVE